MGEELYFMALGIASAASSISHIVFAMKRARSKPDIDIKTVFAAMSATLYIILCWMCTAVAADIGEYRDMDEGIVALVFLAILQPSAIIHIIGGSDE